MKILLLTIYLGFSSLAAAYDKGCTQSFIYESGRKPSNVTHGGTTDYSTTKDEFLYFVCKKHCNELRPQVDYIKGLKSCEINGVPIEQSNYKEIYLRNRKNICYIQVEGKYTYNLYLAGSKNECKSFMQGFYWCKNGEKCTYSYGLE